MGIGGGGCVATTQGVYFRTARDLIFFPVDDGPVEAWRVAEGAAVTLYLWEQSLTSFADAFQAGFIAFARFDGELADTAAIKHMIMA